ncbi:hypothetical protein QCD85_09595 [Paenibacillus sp. PsM32]|uniref:hypothetical protein n=1 Tax=Paenibacillus sp. PsM32 TaxID=3030536 RepID=UPI00263AD94B|nr:hypothetical protein [Paenibacillus sp. PsM32]MDN4618349.1 hypothetical protein [Paenibacillus sp. PsM32]
MEEFHCMNHPDRAAVHQCTRCGKPLCDECYNPEMQTCRAYCNNPATASTLEPQQPQPKNTFWQIVVALLAIVGALALLLAAICGAMIYSY